MNKKADVWISAALYFGLGIVILSIILVAGMPVINKLKDKNVIIQTKEAMFTLNNNILEVVRGGPGAQRAIDVNIKKGNFLIKPFENQIIWSYDTKAILSEPGKQIKEGDLTIETMPSTTSNEFLVTLTLNYANKLNITTDPLSDAPLQIMGPARLVIYNEGVPEVPEGAPLQIKITESTKTQ